jgi:hypothetical protein
MLQYIEKFSVLFCHKFFQQQSPLVQELNQTLFQ